MIVGTSVAKRDAVYEVSERLFQYIMGSASETCESHFRLVNTTE